MRLKRISLASAAATLFIITHCFAVNTPPPKGPGLIVYEPKVDIASVNSQGLTPYMQTYQASGKAASLTWYIYPANCTLSYTGSSWAPLNCIPSIAQTAATYKIWFANTKIIPFIGLDGSDATNCAIYNKTNLQDAANQVLTAIKAVGNQIAGIGFDLEGNCGNSLPAKSVLDIGGSQLISNIAADLPANLMLVVYSGKPRDPLTNKWNLWPALNRTGTNCNNPQGCAMGFWLESGYDETSGDSIQAYNKTVTMDVLSKFVTETKTNANFIQVGLPASASAQDAATYQFFVPPNQPNKAIDTQSIESYLTTVWGAANNIGQPTNCTNGSETVKIPTCYQYNQIYNGISVTQCQYLCAGLSAIDAIFNSDVRTSRTTACNIPVNYVTFIPQGEAGAVSRKQFVGIALYQINQSNVLFNACKEPSAKRCPDGTLKPPNGPQGVSYPETVSPKAWNAFISWLNGETQMNDAIDICK